MSNDIEHISNKITIHSPENPPSTGHGINVDLTLTNQKYLEISNWQKDSQPSFTLIIHDPNSIGLEDSQEYHVEKFVEDVLLACNIVLKRAIFSKHNSGSTKSNITWKKQESTSEVKDTSTGKVVVINETIGIHESVSISVGFKDELDENKVLEILSKIRKINDGTAQSSLKLNDFQKSLNEYDAAMESIERLGVFKHLFSSLELSTNCDDHDDRNGQGLDIEINRITGIDQSKIEDWRNFNSRTKHKDRNPNDERLYQDGLQQLGGKIVKLHEASQKTIQYRFNDIS